MKIKTKPDFGFNFEKEDDTLDYKKYKDYNKKINDIPYKKCKLCGEWLEANLDNFGKCKSKKDGFNDNCRKCRSKNGHDNYLNNKDKYKETIAQKIANNDLYNSKFNDYIIEDDITKIIMTSLKGEDFITAIDTEDLERIKTLGLRWCAKYDRGTRSYYACSTRWEMVDGEPKLVSYGLQTIIANTIKGYYVDHEDHDTLNNRKYNLRIVTMPNNATNRKSKNSNNKSGYRNVCWVKSKEQWVVQLSINGKNTRLGWFDDVDEAGEYAEKMRQKYYGKYAGKS